MYHLRRALRRAGLARTLSLDGAEGARQAERQKRMEECRRQQEEQRRQAQAEKKED